MRAIGAPIAPSPMNAMFMPNPLGSNEQRVDAPRRGATKYAAMRDYTHCSALITHCCGILRAASQHRSRTRRWNRKERHVVYSQYVGARVRRKEDPRLITGSSTYVGDVKLPGLLHCAIVR